MAVPLIIPVMRTRLVTKMSRHSFLPERGERALIVGQTGSGKTAFAVWMLYRIPIAPIIIYDTKDEPKFRKLPNSIIVETIEEVEKAYHNEQIDYVIVRPPVEMLGKPEELDEYLFAHYQNLRDSVCYIDEAYTFHSHGRAYRGLIALLSRGRSRGITTIISTQRPMMISRLCITEAQKVYVFRLGDRQDRKRLGDIIPDFADKAIPPKHGFYYYESGDDNAELYRPVKLDPLLDTGYTDETPEMDNNNTTVNQSPATKHIWV